jgi:hypothetical protein
MGDNNAQFSLQLFSVLPHPKALVSLPQFFPWKAVLLAASFLAIPGVQARSADEASAAPPFLDSLEQRGIEYFIATADPKTGLVPDRAAATGTDASPVASSAATGFGLTALCIGVERGWLDRAAAAGQVRRTLRTLYFTAPCEHGFYYHFMDKTTCRRAWQSEVSSIDTALLVAGVLTARQYFGDPEIKDLATKIYDRVDWPWMLNGEEVLSMGWLPESGFITSRWKDYCELKMLYLLGLGSPTHPLDPACWRSWKREPVLDYRGKQFIACAPLFTHQYSEAWFDFRGRADAYADYWINSVLATEANREFCVDQHGHFPSYSELMWGATASDRSGGYGAWGGPPASGPGPDGTVVPCAVAGSLPFDSANCLLTLEHMRDAYGPKIWGRYGFADAFNPMTGWTASDVLGIDVGITVVMAENARTGAVWKWFMANPEAGLAMRRAGFNPSPLKSGSRTSLLAGLATK